MHGTVLIQEADVCEGPNDRSELKMVRPRMDLAYELFDSGNVLIAFRGWQQNDAAVEIELETKEETLSPEVDQFLLCKG